MTTAELKIRLAEAEEALRAIRAGEVDTVVVTGEGGPRVFTLEGEEHAYRVLIESMNEGALTLNSDKTILYANDCFARMIKCPLEQVSGSSFRRFLSEEDRERFKPLLRRPRKDGSKIQVTLLASDGSRLPVNISIRRLADDANGATFGMVVTDMTESRKSEEALRALTHRVLKVQEEERVRIARELHDTVTQTLCGILVHGQILANGLSAKSGSAKSSALKLCDMLGLAVDEVENISRNLRPSVLDTLGLAEGLRAISMDFSDRTGISVQQEWTEFVPRLSSAIELALYRILQETLRNVEKHSHAKEVTVKLTKQSSGVRLTVQDNGTGFDSDHPTVPKGKKKTRGGLGVVGMRERAASVGGQFNLKSKPDQGTKTEVNIPLKFVA